jgi:hypothetical protein
MPLTAMRFYWGGAFLLVAFLLQLGMIAVFRRMMREVNATLPKESTIPEMGVSLLRGRVIKLHRAYFPASGLRKQMYALWVIEMGAFLSGLACIIRFVH